MLTKNFNIINIDKFLCACCVKSPGQYYPQTLFKNFLRRRLLKKLVNWKNRERLLLLAKSNRTFNSSKIECDRWKRKPGTKNCNSSTKCHCKWGLAQHFRWYRLRISKIPAEKEKSTRPYTYFEDAIRHVNSPVFAWFENYL